LTDLALQTNKALALAEQLIESLRSERAIVPAVTNWSSPYSCWCRWTDTGFEAALVT
jgi:hypothetical protein